MYMGLWIKQDTKNNWRNLFPNQRTKDNNGTPLPKNINRPQCFHILQDSNFKHELL